MKVAWMRSDRGSRKAHALLNGSSLCGHPERYRVTLTPLAAADLTAGGDPFAGNVCAACVDAIVRVRRARRLLAAVP